MSGVPPGLFSLIKNIERSRQKSAIRAGASGSKTRGGSEGGGG